MDFYEKKFYEVSKSYDTACRDLVFLREELEGRANWYEADLQRMKGELQAATEAFDAQSAQVETLQSQLAYSEALLKEKEGAWTSFSASVLQRIRGCSASSVGKCFTAT